MNYVMIHIKYLYSMAYINWNQEKSLSREVHFKMSLNDTENPLVTENCMCQSGNELGFSEKENKGQQG